MATRILHPMLTSCTEPDNEDVVRGILAVIFGASGPKFAAKKLEERLHTHEMCAINLLEQITFAALLDHFQMSYGEALTVDNGIFPKDQQPAPEVVVAMQPCSAAAACSFSADVQERARVPRAGT